MQTSAKTNFIWRYFPHIHFTPIDDECWRCYFALMSTVHTDSTVSLHVWLIVVLVYDETEDNLSGSRIYFHWWQALRRGRMFCATSLELSYFTIMTKSMNSSKRMLKKRDTNIWKKRRSIGNLFHQQLYSDETLLLLLLLLFGLGFQFMTSTHRKGERCTEGHSNK